MAKKEPSLMAKKEPSLLAIWQRRPSLMAKKELPADLWSDMRQEIADEHLLPQAPHVLRDGLGWKAWLNDNGPSKSGGPAQPVAVPAASGMVSRRHND